MKAHFEGKATQTLIGYEVKKRLLGFPAARVPIYRMQLDRHDPMRFWSEQFGQWFRPDMVFSHDQGSIPLQFQCLSWIPGLDLRRDRFVRPYAFHDCAYMEQGLWTWNPIAFLWDKESFDRKKADALLPEMIVADYGTKAEAEAIYAAVRVGGGPLWHSHD